MNGCGKMLMIGSRMRFQWNENWEMICSIKPAVFSVDSKSFSAPFDHRLSMIDILLLLLMHAVSKTIWYWSCFVISVNVSNTYSPLFNRRNDKHGSFNHWKNIACIKDVNVITMETNSYFFFSYFFIMRYTFSIIFK